MKHAICLTMSLLTILFWMSDKSACANERDDFFEAKIRPVLVGTCFRCHGDLKTSGGLRVDSRENLLKGGDSGAAIVPGTPDESLLMRALRRLPDVSAMPPEKDKALRADQIAEFARWIKMGAPWPAKSPKFRVAKHWAFEAVRDVRVPAVPEEEWGQNSIDKFIRAKQRAAGVRPAPPADKLSLIRRATFDLTGLPPSLEEIDAFERDESQQAFETVVNRLLKSPHYGERWGRHWLDVVRYADTAGETADYPVPVAWRYRNYVIDAFNADKPYDEFLREQIAGDILAEQGPPERYAERAAATGFLAISRRFGFDSENYHHLTIQDTIDTLGQTVLGLSLGCARCHDHKFDPVSMSDYYGLYGIFDSSRYAFPGSEQKQKVRLLLPLLPRNESRPKWCEFDARVSGLARSLEKEKRPAAGALLRSLHDFDGDFELQAAAAGGSNGVLVPPWLYEGKIGVTNSAQSPYKNVYHCGKVGVSIPAGAGSYRIIQALYPRRSAENCNTLYVNLDFRIPPSDRKSKGTHRFSLGTLTGSPAVEVFIISGSVSLRIGEKVETLCDLKPNEWNNLQLALDLKSRTVSGTVGLPGKVTHIAAKRFAADSLAIIDSVVFDSLDLASTPLPALEFDNFAVSEQPFPLVSNASPDVAELAAGSDLAGVKKELDDLTKADREHAKPGDQDRAVRETRRRRIAELKPQLATLQKKSDSANQELIRLLSDGPFAMTYGMAEGTPHDVRMQMRGEPDQPGVKVPRRFLKVLGGEPLPAGTRGSGRLELATWLTQPGNPLTARVMVNRIWQYHFGRGLVKTPNDFGVRGLPPTHPELLDHLASQFIRNGWSVKAMHRIIMLSATYQQSSLAGTLQGATADVTDLYTSYPRRRLSAEEIRDAILAVSGELDLTPAREHPFPTPVTWGYSQHGPFSAVYNHDKRSVYLMTQRLRRHPFLALFDGADPNATTAVRLGTTVPTQALFFMNDPFVHAKAEKWAARLMALPTESLRIERAVRIALGHPASMPELAEALEFLAAYRAELTAIGKDNVAERSLAAYLRTLFGSNEFLHVD